MERVVVSKPLICEDEKIDKWRLVFDATVSGVNPLVRLPEKCELPGIQDLMGILQTGYIGDDVVGLKVDVKSAFRRIRLRKDQRRKSNSSNNHTAKLLSPL